MSNNSLRNIFRNKAQNCWQVRITRKGIERSKTFTDSKMEVNSPALSLAYAVVKRDEMLAASFKNFVNNY